MEVNLLNAIVAGMGILILSEALILIAAMNILKVGDWAWMSFKNSSFLFLDVLGGIGIIYFATVNSENQYLSLIFILFLLQLGTHIYRLVEHIRQSEKKFCDNSALVIFNRVKLAGIIGVMYYLIW